MKKNTLYYDGDVETDVAPKAICRGGIGMGRKSLVRAMLRAPSVLIILAQALRSQPLRQGVMEGRTW